MSLTTAKRLPLNKQGRVGDSWFLQEKHWELGDFVTATPMLHALAEAWGEPVPVFFETPYVGDLYEKCPFIKRFSSAPLFTAPFADTKAPRTLWRKGNTSNYEAQYMAVFGDPLPTEFKAYAPQLAAPKEFDPKGKRTIAFMHGCYSDALREAKSIPPPKMYNIICDAVGAGYTPIIIGSRADEPYWIKVLLEGYLSTLAEKCHNYLGLLDICGSVQLLQTCDLFCSNDTGLYHVAAASDMKGMVLWNSTPLIPYRAPSPLVYHVTEDHVQYFSDWISAAHPLQ